MLPSEKLGQVASKLPSPSLSASFRRSGTISTAARRSILTTPAQQELQFQQQQEQ